MGRKRKLIGRGKKSSVKIQLIHELDYINRDVKTIFNNHSALVLLNKLVLF